MQLSLMAINRALRWRFTSGNTEKGANRRRRLAPFFIDINFDRSAVGFEGLILIRNDEHTFGFWIDAILH